MPDADPTCAHASKTHTGAPPTGAMCLSLGCCATRSSVSPASLIRCLGAASGGRGDGGAGQSARGRKPAEARALGSEPLLAQLSVS